MSKVYLFFPIRFASVFVLGATLLPALYAQQPSTNSPPVPAPVSSAAPPKAATPTIQSNEHLSLAEQKSSKGDVAGAFAEAETALKLDPQNGNAYLVRGSFHAQKKEWADAARDYEMARGLTPAIANLVKFDLSELKFMQKDYDGARPGFVDLQSDKDIGDLAAYKVFLCDLLGHHEDVATKELAAFDQVGGNPSYYFANASWDLLHQKTEDARSWFLSAFRIYADNPQKLTNYSASLKNLGYLPLPPKPEDQ
jgi:tetratricopeptide (TPR) repeat protein